MVRKFLDCPPDDTTARNHSMQQSIISVPKYCWQSLFQCEVIADLFLNEWNCASWNEDFYTDVFKENLGCDTLDTSFSTTILLCEYFWSIMAGLISPTLHTLTFLFLKLKIARKVWIFHVSRIQEQSQAMLAGFQTGYVSKCSNHGIIPQLKCIMSQGDSMEYQVNPVNTEKKKALFTSF